MLEERVLRTARQAMLAVLVLCAVVSVGLAVLVAWPFSPYEVYSSRVVPSSVCPGADVTVSGDSEIEGGWRITRIETESAWEEAKPSARSEGRVVSGGTGIVYEPSPRERSEVESTVLRSAPETPGSYRLTTRAQVYGTFSGPFRGFPKTDTLRYTTRDELVVRDCEAGPEPERALATGGAR